MINKKKKIKNLKPIEYDIHLKYLCRCGQHHWLSYNEASEKDFIIVCECQTLLRVKPLSGIIVKYKENKKSNKINTSNTKKTEQTNNKTDVVDNHEKHRELPENLVNACSNLLITFGYSKKEAIELIKNFYSKNKDIEYSKFVKSLLSSIGESK
jgi:hypothetical protein